MRTLKLTIAYDGTRLVGWQRQADGVSVQALLEDALAPLEGARRVVVTGAGRTDAGVHAAGQVASCRVENALEPSALARALNARLPEDVRVRAVEVVPDGFHARYAAVGKTYGYCVLNGPVADPLARHVAWHVREVLDADAMARALALVEGEHDFKAFQAAGTQVRDTVRTLWRASLEVRPWTGAWGPLPAPSGPPPVPDLRGFFFQLHGSGFLRHMVRTIVGTAVEVGLGRRAAGEMQDVVASRDRRRAGPTAPPHGLTLVAVHYASPPRRYQEGRR